MPKAVFVADGEGSHLYCGSIGEPDLHKGIGHVVESLLLHCDSVAPLVPVNLAFVIKEMTVEQVEALPNV